MLTKTETTDNGKFVVDKHENFCEAANYSKKKINERKSKCFDRLNGPRHF